jgi:DNA-binding NtrC family response regulator
LVPDQKTIIASGFAETERVRAAQKLGAHSYLKKPYTLEKLGVTVRAALDHRSPA